MSEQYVTSVFPPRNPQGGMGFTFEMASQRCDGKLQVISSDQEPFETATIRNIPIPPSEEGLGEAWHYWSGAGIGNYLMAPAYTAPAMEKGALEFMYAKHLESGSSYSLGSFELLDEFVKTHSIGDEAIKRFYRRFENAVADIPGGSVMNWQGYLSEVAVEMYGESLRERGVNQTWYFHEIIPDNLEKSEYGRQLLKAFSLVDEVYLHTDEFARRVEKQMELLRLPMPKVARYDLGIDIDFIDRSIATVTANNYEQSVPGFETLPLQSKSFIAEAFRVKGMSERKVPHLFLSADRVGPPKGTTTVYAAIHQFLSERKAAGENLPETYRFFVIENVSQLSPESPQFDLYERYKRHALSELRKLEEAFPGVVFASQAFTAESRVVLPALMKGMHGISGGVADGLNMAIMESAYANRDEDTSIIVGRGAGFAMQAEEDGFASSGYFIDPGSALQMKESFSSAVKSVSRAPGDLLRAKRVLVDKEILLRDDVVIGGK